MYILGQSVITCGSAASMPDCNHEEADTRMVVLLRHALLMEGAVTVLAQTYYQFG